MIFHSYEMPRVVKFMEPEKMVARSWGCRRNRELLFSGYGISVWKDEKRKF